MTRSSESRKLFTERLPKVLSYENRNIVLKFAEENNIPFKSAETYFEEIKKFLLLCSISKERFAPSKEIDKIWHTFILFTKEYRFFCFNYLGKFIDHVPEVKYLKEVKKGKSNNYQNTIKAIHEVYSEINDDLWPTIKSSDCYMTGDCFDCLPDTDCGDCGAESEEENTENTSIENRNTSFILADNQ